MKSQVKAQGNQHEVTSDVMEIMNPAGGLSDQVGKILGNEDTAPDGGKDGKDQHHIDEKGDGSFHGPPAPEEGFVPAAVQPVVIEDHEKEQRSQRFMPEIPDEPVIHHDEEKDEHKDIDEDAFFHKDLRGNRFSLF